MNEMYCIACRKMQWVFRWEKRAPGEACSICQWQYRRLFDALAPKVKGGSVVPNRGPEMLPHRQGMGVAKALALR